MPEKFIIKSRIESARAFLYIGLVFVFIFTLSFFLDFKTQAAAEPPEIVTYQGKLLINNLSASTTQSMKFVLYDSLTGGSALYSASGTLPTVEAISVTPTSGIFSVDLGGTGTNSLDPSIFRDNQNVYLEVIVGAETLEPRKQLAATPYAFNAKYLDGYAASSTSPASQHIPLTDSAGNVDFNNVTSTKSYVNGNFEVTGTSTIATTTIASTTVDNANITNLNLLGTLSGVASTDLSDTADIARLNVNQRFSGTNTYSATTTLTTTTLGSTSDLKLTLDGDGGIVAKGTFGSGLDLSTSGAGTRLIWYPKKAAFRAGYVNSTQFDDASIGNYSVAMGSRNSALAEYSIAAGGFNNLISASYGAVLGGSGNIAASFAAVGGGLSNNASGNYSAIAGGNDNTADGDTSAVGGGEANNAGGSYAVIPGGYSNFADGDYSFASGGNMALTLNADRTFVYGYAAGGKVINQADSVIFYHDNGTKMGVGTTTPQYNLTVSGTAYISTDLTLGGELYGVASTDLSDTANIARLDADQTFAGLNIFSATTTLATTTIGGGTSDLKLTINGDGGIVANGTQGAGLDLTAAGAGTRMIWYPKKAAFRAGGVAADQWDEGNIGNYSFVNGLSNKATANYTAVIGGTDNIASNIASIVAGGYNNTASGHAAIVSAGTYNTASGNYSVAVSGEYNVAAGNHSLAGGSYMQLSADADRTFAWGYSGTAKSITQADSVIFYHDNGTKMGVGTTTPQYNLTVSGTAYISTDLTVDTDTLFVDSDNNRIGIGTTTPGFKLTLDGDAGIFSSSTFGSGTDLPYSGAGTRLIWYPKKAAFRAGYVSGSEWDDASVGNYSVAFGEDNTASGPGMAVGGGKNNSASNINGYSVVSGGEDNSVWAKHAVVGGGYNNIVNSGNGYGGIFTGSSNNITASGFATILGGSSGSISGWSSAIINGSSNNVTGGYSTIANGYENAITSVGGYSFIPAGFRATTAGDYSFTGGRYIQLSADADRTFAWGFSNDAVSITQPDSVIFYHGSGAGSSTKMGVGTTTPQYNLTVSGTAYISTDLTLGGELYGVASTDLSDTANIARLDADQSFTGLNTFSATTTLATTTIGGGTSDLKLTINGDGGIVANGTYGSGLDLTAAGVGTRLIWYPKKSAFRAGYVDGTQWDNANIGAYSIALGTNNEASNTDSAVLGGKDNIASNLYSTVAGGWGNTASGTVAFASGYYNLAWGDYSWVGGRGMRLGDAGDRTFVWGYDESNLDVTQSDSVIFYNENGTSFGIDTVTPNYTLDVNGTLGVTNTSTLATTTITNLTVDTDTLYVNNLTNRVGIGTTTPEFKLSLNNDGGIIAHGTYGAGSTLTSSGAGTKMIWYPRKAAFRAGYVSSNEWNDTNIGDYSTAFGYGTQVTADYAFSAGSNSIASANYSTSFGNQSNAGGESSFAVGDQAFTVGDYAAAIGYHTEANGNSSFAVGFNSVASASASFALGYRAKANHQGSFVWADSTSADFASNAQDVFLVRASGGVGINTTTPDYDLTVSGTVYVGGDITVWTNPSVSATNTLSFSTTTLFESSVPDYVSSTAFVFNAENLTSVSNRYLLSLRMGGTSKFSVAANGDVHAAGTLNASNATVGTPGTPGDLAERVDIAIDDIAEPGDVVVIDPSAPDTYRRSSGTHEQAVAGVISTNPTIVVGNGQTGYTAVLAMVGRVPVKVSTENGSIQRGDLLVSASLPGHAMKYDPNQDDNKMVGVVGVALDNFDEDTGKIMSLIRTGWVHNRTQTILSLQNAVQQIASGEEVDPNDLNVEDNEGYLVYNGGNLNLHGSSILNVASIQGKDNKWAIDSQGRLITKIETSDGDKKFYGMSSPEVEFVFSSSSQLIGGEVEIEFEQDIQDVIDPEQSIRVTVTLTSGEAQGVYVAEKSHEGFTVKELNDGSSEATFDWMVIAKRSDSEVVEEVIPEIEPSIEPEPESDPTQPEDPVEPENSPADSGGEEVPTEEEVLPNNDDEEEIVEEEVIEEEVIIPEPEEIIEEVVELVEEIPVEDPVQEVVEEVIPVVEPPSEPEPEPVPEPSPPEESPVE